MGCKVKYLKRLMLMHRNYLQVLSFTCLFRAVWLCCRVIKAVRVLLRKLFFQNCSVRVNYSYKFILFLHS